MSAKNVSFADRKIRLLIGLVLILLGIVFFAINQAHLGIFVVAISLIPLFTSATGTCPLNNSRKQSANQE